MPWKRAILCLCALVAPFFIPWWLAAALGFFAAFFFPPIAIMIGIIIEVLYYTGGIPYFLIGGFVAAGIAFFVHRFLKTRIMY